MYRHSFVLGPLVIDAIRRFRPDYCRRVGVEAERICVGGENNSQPMSRPEHVAPPEVFYNDAEAEKYLTSSRMIEIQTQLADR